MNVPTLQQHPMHFAVASPREPSSSPARLLRTLAKDFSNRPLRYAALFASIALLGLGVGMVLPKKYASRTSILVEDSNIIRPLMEGRAVPTAVADRAALAKEVAFSNKVMKDVLAAGGWLHENPTPVQQDKLIEQVKARTEINTGEKLIQIEYVDSDPQRAYKVTKAFGDQVISESLATKDRESREAFAFIDAQVQSYHTKLKEAEARLEAYRNANPDARPGVEAEVSGRIGDLRRQVDSAEMELENARSREGAIALELGKESEIAVVQTREGQIRANIADLTTERGKLLLNYTEQHPDVVRINHQLSDLQEQLRKLDDRREAAAKGGTSSIETSASINPLYGELRSKLAAAKGETASLQARQATARQLLGGVMVQGQNVAAAASALAELTRDYEVNRDLYQDLLKRRENARLSMNLDAGRQGLSFRVQEPAMVPLRASGLRLMHVAGASLVLASLVPLALLFLLVRFDGKLRSSDDIEQKAGVPLLGVTPRYLSHRRRSARLRQSLVAAVLILAVPVVYGFVAMSRMGGW